MQHNSADYEPVVTTCVCEGSGYFSVDVGDDIHHPWFGKLFPCACRQKDITTSMQNDVGSIMLNDVLLKDVKAISPASRKMKNGARHFVNELVRSYAVWGTNGSGKSTTLMAICNEFLEKGVPAIYITAYDAVEWIKAGFGEDFDAAARIDRLVRIPVLCLDELSQVRWTDYVAETLETILDRRYRIEAKTALAMDQDPSDVLPPRFESRMMAGLVVKIDDADWRPRIGQAATDRAAAMDRGE